MAISYTGGKIQVDGYASGSFTATTYSATTIGYSSAGWTTNAYIGRIVWIISGTGAGATGYILSNTSTVATVEAFYLVNSTGEVITTVTPDNTSVFAIAFNYADCISAEPTYCSWESATTQKTMKVSVEILVKAAAALADSNRNLTFTTDHNFIDTEYGSLFQSGRITTSKTGVDGGLISVTIDTSSHLTKTLYGFFKLYGAVMITNRYPAYTSGEFRWNVTNPSRDGVHIVDCYLNQVQVLFMDKDVFVRVTCAKNRVGQPNASLGPPFKLDAIKYPEGAISLGPMRGADVFDFESIGTVNDATFIKPLAYNTSTLPNFVTYMWRPKLGIYTDLTACVDWFTGSSTRDGILYFGTTVAVTSKNTDDSALGTVAIGVIKTSDGTGKIVTGKNSSGSNYSPITARFIETDGSGLYEGPFSSGEGVFVLTHKLVNGGSVYLSTVTDYTGYTLIGTKYGYTQQVASRSYSYNTGATDALYMPEDAYSGLFDTTATGYPVSYATAIAYTNIAWNSTAKTLVLSGATTLQKLYDFVKANVEHEATTNDTHVVDPFTTTDGSNYTLASGWDLTVLNHLDFQSKRISGGTLIFTTATAYSPILGTNNAEFTASSGTYNLASADINGTITLINTGGGSITVQLPTGTSYVNTGPNITVDIVSVQQGTTFTGLVAGSVVKVFDTGLTTELYSTLSSGTSEAWSQTWAADVDFDYVIMKAGYVPIRVTGSTAGQGVTTTPISQVADRAYAASSGLTYGTIGVITATDLVSGTFQVTSATTIQNFYSFCIEEWIDNCGVGASTTDLANVAFPISKFGPNSFSFADWVFSDGETSIAFTSRDGLRTLNTAGAVTGTWAALLSQGVPAGKTVTYQQVAGTGTASANATGNIDQLIKVYEDTNGDGSPDFDYTGHLVLKLQDPSYEEASADAFSTYGTLEDQLYVVGLTPISDGIASASPTGITITDLGASPDTWNGLDYSIKITDSASPHTGEEIIQYIRSQTGDTRFNFHDLVRTNGSSYKTVRGAVQGGAGAALKGVYVVQSDGTTPHTAFNLFTADDGSTWVPPVIVAATISGLVAGTRVQIWNQTGEAEADWAATTAYSVGDGVRPSPKSVTITQTGGVATATHTAHGYSTGHRVIVVGADQSEYNISAIITVTDVDHYTYSIHDNPASPATGTITSQDYTFWHECETAGTSGGTEPTWTNTVDGATTDSTVTWKTRALEISNTTSSTGTSVSANYEHFGTNRTLAIKHINISAPVTAGSFDTGLTYTILSAGTTDFTLIGAADSNVGTIFTATGAGTGTGTATLGTYKKYLSQSGTVSSSGLTVTAIQDDNTIYEDNNVDGSSITEFSVTGSVIRIYVNDPDNTTTAQRMYNWYLYYLSTEAGIRDQANYISATDQTHYVFDNLLQVYNQDTVNPLTITGANIVPTTGAATNIFDLSNLASMAVNFNRVEAFVYSTGSGLSTAQDTALSAINTKTAQLTFTQAGEVDSNVQSVNDVAIVGDGSATPFNV